MYPLLRQELTNFEDADGWPAKPHPVWREHQAEQDLYVLDYPHTGDPELVSHAGLTRSCWQITWTESQAMAHAMVI